MQFKEIGSTRLDSTWLKQSSGRSQTLLHLDYYFKLRTMYGAMDAVILFSFDSLVARPLGWTIWVIRVLSSCSCYNKGAAF